MSRTTLADRLVALDEVLAEGEGRLDVEQLSVARAVRERAAERLARGDDVVVAALCGGTGSGKSTLFNALAGAELAPTGVRRPTTADVRALAVGDPAATGALCDWLEVGHRHHVEADDELPDGLVLLDLPDTDSIAVDHRVLAARFIERVDLLVWVTDPVKYGHRALHDAYLRRLSAHADVVVVVLNRVDELADSERATLLEDLRRLLAADGLGEARVTTTSARTGEGVDALRSLLADEARRRRAVAARITADVRDVAAALRTETASGPEPRLDERGLVAALAGAAGVPAIGSAAAGVYRRDARAGTRGLPSRGVASVGRRIGAPLRATRGLLPGGRASGPALGPGSRPTGAGVLGAGSADPDLPVAASTPLAVRRALADVSGAAAIEALPALGRARVTAVADDAGRRLPRRLADAVDGVRVAPPRRRWWTPVALLLTVLEATVVVGVVWLAVLAVLDYLLLPAPPTPMVTERLPWPTALVLGGVLLRIVAGLVRRRLVAIGAARHRRLTERRLRDAVAAVAREAVVEPVRAELAAQARVRNAVERAAR